MSYTNFGSWLRGQQYRNDQIGELACWVVAQGPSTYLECTDLAHKVGCERWVVDALLQANKDWKEVEFAQFRRDRGDRRAQ